MAVAFIFMCISILIIAQIFLFMMVIKMEKNYEDIKAFIRTKWKNEAVIESLNRK